MANRLTSRYILRRLSSSDLRAFSALEFRRFLGLSPARGNEVLHRLSVDGDVQRISRGKYILGGWYGSTDLSHPFLLGGRIVEPSYVSFWSALHHYGWTEQVPRTVFLATTHRSQVRSFGNFRFRYVHLAPARFCGYESLVQGGAEFLMASPEKALIDSLLLSENAGGMPMVVAAWGEARASLDLSNLAELARRMRSASLASRLGHLLQSSGESTEDLKSVRSRAYVRLDPRGPRRGRYDSTWKVIDNLEAR